MSESISSTEKPHVPYAERKALVRRDYGPVSDQVLDVYGPELTATLWDMYDHGADAMSMAEFLDWATTQGGYELPDSPPVEIMEEYWARRSMDPFAQFGDSSN